MNRLLHRVTCPDPFTLTLYCQFASFSTTMPCFSHLLFCPCTNTCVSTGICSNGGVCVCVCVLYHVSIA